MANKEHVKILKQGVEVWNKWRNENPNIRPELKKVEFIRSDLKNVDFSFADLSSADLRNANLREANLRSANLREANLFGADLSETYLWTAYLWSTNLSEVNLFEADLREANLKNSDLGGANLTGVNFKDSNLYGANLSGANLREASFRKTVLTEANLSKTFLLETIFSDTDLSKALNLDKCEFGGPSSIDHRTLYKSKNLPISFLQGIGFSDIFIDHIPSLFLDQAIQFYSCFISYSSKDDGFAKRLHADLQNNGIRCWFAPEDMKIGDKIRPSIEGAIKYYDKLLLILSKNSIDSTWVEKEVETAFEKETKNKHTALFPIRMDDTVMKSETAWAADIRRTRNIGDFKNWKDHDSYQKSFERLLRDLKQTDE